VRDTGSNVLLGPAGDIARALLGSRLCGDWHRSAVRNDDLANRRQP
jgi:hypothetical protein